MYSTLLTAGSIIVDHTTASVTIAQDVNQRTQEAGIGFIDAPISGGQSGAEQGILSIMCGGTEEHFEKALPIMGSYGKTMTLIGPSGSGQFTKMVNQIPVRRSNTRRRRSNSIRTQSRTGHE